MPPPPPSSFAPQQIWGLVAGESREGAGGGGCRCAPAGPEARGGSGGGGFREVLGRSQGKAVRSCSRDTAGGGSCPWRARSPGAGGTSSARRRGEGAAAAAPRAGGVVVPAAGRKWEGSAVPPLGESRELPASLALSWLPVLAPALGSVGLGSALETARVWGEWAAKAVTSNYRVCLKLH